MEMTVLGAPFCGCVSDTVLSLCASHLSSSGAPCCCCCPPFGEIRSLVWRHTAEIWFLVLYTRDLRVWTSVPLYCVHSFTLFFRNIEAEGKLRKENPNPPIINLGSVLFTAHQFHVRHLHGWSCFVPIETFEVGSQSGLILQISWVFETAYNCVDTGYLDQFITLLI